MSATALPPAAESEDLRVEVASQWQLVWWKFRRHKLALVSLFVILAVYLVAVFTEFIAPYGAEHNDAKYPLVGPQRVQWIDRSGGGWRLAPYVYGLKVDIDRESLRRRFADDRDVRIPLALLRRGGAVPAVGAHPDVPPSAHARPGGRADVPAREPTGSAATCSAASSTGRGSRCRSA